MASTDGPLRIAALIKQIPEVEEMRLGSDGHLVRDGVRLEMSAYCRRAVSKAVELAASRPGSSVTVVTLGPPSAEDVLREAIMWGLDREVDIRGVLLTDRRLAGSDTIATALALASALRREGPFDLILMGRNSLDADTAQVPPQLAELLDLPFATGVKELDLEGALLRVGCEHDDGWVDAELDLPAVLSCAERLCDPSKVPPDRRAEAPADLIRTVTADDLGSGPWGVDASLTTVGPARTISVDRLRAVSADAPVATQVKDAIRVLLDRGAFGRADANQSRPLPATGGDGGIVAVIAEAGQDALARELCGLAARLASSVSGSTVLLAAHDVDAADAGSWGVDLVVDIEGADVEEDIAHAVAAWAQSAQPLGILAGSTAFGREVASRVAARISAGLTGDAIDVEMDGDRFVAWKPAFGGQLVAPITATSPVQMATVRAGVLPSPATREHVADRTSISASPRRRVRVLARRREDELERLSEARVVIGIGKGVRPDELGHLEDLRVLLDAEIGATRKVTDAGWMPHARQIGITGRSIAPQLFVSIGASGKFNHMVGVRASGSVLAINPDRKALVWEHCDVGIVAEWQECVPLLVEELRQALSLASSG